MRPVVSEQSYLRNPLNQLLGTEANVRLIRALTNETEEPLSAPDIAARSGLTIQWTRKALKRLFKSGFVLRVGGGRKHQYELNRSDKLVKAVLKRGIYRTIFASYRQRSIGSNENLILPLK